MADRRSSLIIGIAVVIVLGGVGAWIFAPGADAVDARDLTELTDSAAIAETLSIDALGISTSENYFGHRIRVISGVLTNVSGKSIYSVDLRFNFLDYDGNTVEEGVYSAFNTRQRPLEPGAGFRFEVAFENLPQTWNHRVPAVEIVKITY